MYKSIVSLNHIIQPANRDARSIDPARATDFSDLEAPTDSNHMAIYLPDGGQHLFGGWHRRHPGNGSNVYRKLIDATRNPEDI